MNNNLNLPDKLRAFIRGCLQRRVRRIHSIFSNALSDILGGNHAGKNPQGLSTDGSFIYVAPRFDCYCIDWYTNGDKTSALKCLMLALDLSDEDIVSEGVLSLGCRKHRKNSGVFRFTLIPRQNNWCISAHTPNAKVSDGADRKDKS